MKAKAAAGVDGAVAVDAAGDGAATPSPPASPPASIDGKGTLINTYA